MSQLETSSVADESWQKLFELVRKDGVGCGIDVARRDLELGRGTRQAMARPLERLDHQPKMTFLSHGPMAVRLATTEPRPSRSTLT